MTQEVSQYGIEILKKNDAKSESVRGNFGTMRHLYVNGKSLVQEVPKKGDILDC